MTEVVFCEKRELSIKASRKGENLYRVGGMVMSNPSNTKNLYLPLLSTLR